MRPFVDSFVDPFVDPFVDSTGESRLYKYAERISFNKSDIGNGSDEMKSHINNS